MPSKLRIGILTDGDTVPAWAYRMIEEIINSQTAEICLIIKNEAQSHAAIPPRPLALRIWHNRKKLLYILYGKFDRKKFNPLPDAFELKKISDLLKTDTITVTPIRKKFSDTFREEDIDRVKAYHLDLIIRLGFRILRGGILRSAAQGIWSYHHGDNRINRGGPPGFWEVMGQWPETGALLQILSEDLDNGFVLEEYKSTTRKKSVVENQNNYFWKAASILPDKVRELYHLGPEAFLAKHLPLNQHPRFYSNRLFVEPGNREMLRGMWQLIKDKLKWEYNNAFYLDQWCLLYHVAQDPAPATSFYRFKRLLPPKDRFWADPQALYRNGRYYLFMEELIYSENKGFISVMELDEKGNTTLPRKVLERPYHLSFPFLAESGNELYMIPETHANRTIELYHCKQFPDKWELVQTLLEGVNAVDTTIWQEGDTCFLFTTIQRQEGSDDHDELHIFFADSVTSSHWQPHPMNPVVRDVKTGRQAGKMFRLNDKLYRMAQDGSKHYGYCMHLLEVEELTKTTYREKIVDTIRPQWAGDIIATHTYNHTHHLTVIDAMIRRKK